MVMLDNQDEQTPFERYQKESPTAATPKSNASSRRCCSCKAWASTLIVMGVLSVIVGILYGTALPAILNSAINDNVRHCTLSQVTKASYVDPYGNCKDCSPYYATLYMLNATNAEDYLARNAKLQVKEVGPYVYRRREIKLNVTLANDASTVTYKMYTYHTYEPEKSCPGCSELDESVSFDAGYLSVIAATGGEWNFLASLASQSFAVNATITELQTLLAAHGEQLMRWLNGLNSLNPGAMRNVTDNARILRVLTTGPDAIADLNLSTFAFNGLFVKRTARQWALGYPSLLTGFVLGANYINNCQPRFNDICASCEGDACVPIAAACNQCTRGAAVLAGNARACRDIESIYAAEYGDTEAASFVASTCGLCETVGLCAASLPGSIETSGVDHSQAAPDASTLGDYVKRTGCDDLTKIGTYVQYDGMTVSPVWADLGERRNPTLAELQAFTGYATCDDPGTNVTCFPVSGTDGLSLKPGGVTLTGLASSLSSDYFNAYVGVTRTYFPITSLNKTLDFKGVTLHRFSTLRDTFKFTSTRDIGTGVPVDGLHQLSFIADFLAYLSGPFFINSHPSLLEAVDMSTRDGTKMTHDSMYNPEGELVESVGDAYRTFVDIEAGTGQTMRAHKRTQISYAIAASSSRPNVSMSDVVWPSLPLNVVLPTYWVQEAGEANDSLIDEFKKLRMIIQTFLPGLVVFLIVGVAEIGAGLFLWRREKLKLDPRSVV